MTPHPGDDLQLYALGALDDDARSAVDAHVATCAACAAELGEAERVIFALDDAYVEPAVLPPSPFATTGVLPIRRRTQLGVKRVTANLLAAALLFAIGFGSGHIFERHPATGPGDEALTTIAGSHFLHVSMTRASADAPTAKILYARDGRWIYAIVNAPADAYRLRVTDRAHTGPDAAFTGDATNGTLFEPHLTEPLTSARLIRTSDGAVVANATLVYPPKPAP